MRVLVTKVRFAASAGAGHAVHGDALHSASSALLFKPGEEFGKYFILQYKVIVLIEDQFSPLVLGLTSRRAVLGNEILPSFWQLMKLLERD